MAETNGDFRVRKFHSQKDLKLIGVILAEVMGDIAIALDRQEQFLRFLHFSLKMRKRTLPQGSLCGVVVSDKGFAWPGVTPKALISFV